MCFDQKPGWYFAFLARRGIVEKAFGFFRRYVFPAKFDKITYLYIAKQVIDMDIGRAVEDPAAAFGSPEAVLKDTRLSTDQKRHILLRWQQDAKLLELAAAENMSGGEPNMLHRVSGALLHLDD